MKRCGDEWQVTGLVCMGDFHEAVKVLREGEYVKLPKWVFWSNEVENHEKEKQISKRAKARAIPYNLQIQGLFREFLSLHHLWLQVTGYQPKKKVSYEKYAIGTEVEIHISLNSS